MTQDNAPLDESKKEEAPAKPVARRRWVKILVGVIVAIVLLIVLIPTIASFGFVRSIVVGKINQNLDGKVAIDDWSLGWFSGAALRGVSVYEPNGEKVASIEKISTQLSMLSALRGKYALGKTNIDGCEFWVKLDKEGQSNLAKLPRKHAVKPQAEQAPTNLPDVSGDFTIHAKGQIQRPDMPIARVTSATITASLPSIHDTLTQHAEIDTAIGNSPAGKIVSDGKIPVQAILNILDKHAPGQTGSVDIAWTMPDLQPVVTALSGEVSLLPDVKITGGEFDQATHLDIREKDVAITNRLSFSAQGTRGIGASAQPIKLDKIDVSKADATFDPTKQSLAGIGDLSLNINSPFITLTGGGSSLSKLNLQGQFDLDKLHDQLAQFFDLSKTKLAGNLTLNIASTGDVASSNKPVNTQVIVGVRNLALTLPDKPSIELAGLDLRSDARVDLNSNQIDTAQISLQTSDGKNTVIDCNLTAAGVDPMLMNVKHFDVNKLNVMDLATAQKQLDMFVPQLSENGLRITAGQLYTSVSGSIDGKTHTIKFDQGNPLEMTTPGLTVQKVDDDGQALDVLKDEKITASIMGDVSMPTDGPMSASIKTLSIDTQHKLFAIKKNEGADLTFRMDDNSMSGAGSLLVSADIKALKDLAARFGGDVQVQTGSGQLTSGQLNATVTLSNPKPQTIVQLDGTISNISVTTADPNHPISNETVKITAKAVSGDAPADAGKISAQANLQSAFATVDLKQADYSLKDKQIAKAQLLLSAPDLAKLNDVVIAFMPSSAAPTTAPVQKSGKKKSKAPPATAPSSPIQITSGSMTVALNLAHDSSPGAKAFGGLGGDGLLTIPAASISGMDIAGLVVPITLDGGVATTLYRDKSSAKPATCNGGTLDFSNIVCDLTKDSPRLTMANLGKGRRLVHNVSINPVLGDSVGKFINPVFTNSKRATGSLDVTITNCENLALGNKLMSADSGSARAVISVSDMELVDPAVGPLVGGLVNKITGSIPKPVLALLGKNIPGVSAADSNTFRGQIKDGVVSIEKGVATSDLTLMLIDNSTAPAGTQPVSKKKLAAQFAEGMPLRFWGDVHLDTLEQSLRATVPTELVARYLRAIQIKNIDLAQTLTQAFPQGIPVGVKGTTTSPEFDYSAVGDVFAKRLEKIGPQDLNQVNDIVNQLLNKKEKGK